MYFGMFQLNHHNLNHLPLHRKLKTQIKSELAGYLNTDAGLLTKSTLIQAINDGGLFTWTGLT